MGRARTRRVRAGEGWVAMTGRLCMRTGCSARAVRTLTYDYASQSVVVGPLSPQHVPGSYHLCREHAERTSPPHGWDLVQLPEQDQQTPVSGRDDLMALADAIREVGLRHDDPGMVAAQPEPPSGSVVVLAEKRHLRVIADR